jgi:hypothetical protein
MCFGWQEKQALHHELLTLLDGVRASKGGQSLMKAREAVTKWLTGRLNEATSQAQTMGARAIADRASDVLLRTPNSTEDAKNNNFFLFLVGPPGTMKTTLIEKLAELLGVKIGAGLVQRECGSTTGNGQHILLYITNVACALVIGQPCPPTLQQPTTFIAGTYGSTKKKALREELEAAGQWARRAPHTRVALGVFNEIDDVLPKAGFQNTQLKPLFDNEWALPQNFLFVFVGNLLSDRLADAYGWDNSEADRNKGRREKLDDWEKACAKELKRVLPPKILSRSPPVVICPPPTIERVNILIRDELKKWVNETIQARGFDALTPIDYDSLDPCLLHASRWGYDPKTAWRQLYDNVIPGVMKDVLDEGLAQIHDGTSPRLSLRFEDDEHGGKIALIATEAATEVQLASVHLPSPCTILSLLTD